MNSISVIIVTHNNENHIGSCISSVLKAGIKPEHVYLVDNNSHDRTVAIAQQHKINVFTNETNKGFASACNQAADHVPRDNQYLLFLNPDAFLGEASSLQRVLHFFETYPETGVVGGILQDDQGKQEQFNYGNPVHPFSLITRKFINVTHQSTSQPFEVGWVSAGAMIVRQMVWEKIQGFDPAFFMYWEDVDICKRVHKQGYKVTVFPSWIIQHIRGASLGDKKQKAKIYDQSADTYFQKHYPSSIWMYRIFRWFYRQLRSQAS